MSVNLSINSNNTNTNYTKPSIGARIGGGIAGYAAAGGVFLIPQVINKSLAKQLVNVNKSLNEDEFKIVSDGLEKTLVDTGLKDKGVEIVRAEKHNEKEVIKLITDETNANGKLLPGALKNELIIKTANALYGGYNAAYLRTSKKILMPANNGLELAIFHEMGHAVNANLTKACKILQKNRSMSILSTPILLISLFKTKKAPGQKSDNPIGKTTDFIKNNAGKLSFLTFVPALAEEAIASIRGNSYAKKVLNPELAAKAAKINKLGFKSYAITTAFVSLGIALGSKVKDMIAKPKPIEQ